MVERGANTLNIKNKVVFALLLLCLVLFQLVGCAEASTAPLVTDGSGLSTYQLEIDLFGTKNEFPVDSQGKLKTEVNLSSADGRISLYLSEGTLLLDKEGEPLKVIDVAIDPNLLTPPEDAYIVGAVYDFRPEGADFNPPIKLTLSYDPEELPEGIRERDVYIACYQDGEWEKLLYKSVDTGSHKVTTQIGHFARFAVLASKEHPTSDVSSSLADRVEVVYFHRKERCPTCRYAEDGIRDTIETYFADELASGKLTFEVVNVQDKENAAIVDKYGAFTSSLFINTIRDGTEHIDDVTDDIWLLLGNDEEFVEEVKSKIEKSLGEVR